MATQKPQRMTTRVKKKKMLKALEESHGIVATASKSCGVSRTAHYKWMQSDKKYALEVEDILENAKDFVEGKLYDLIERGNPAGIIFYLKTKGKSRGFDETNDIKLEGNIEIEIISREDKED